MPAIRASEQNPSTPVFEGTHMGIRTPGFPCCIAVK